MRKVQFRGLSEGGCWITGNLIQYEYDGVLRCQIEHTAPDDFGAWDVNPATVGQYTGLKDKKGEQIYEGDVVELYNGSGQKFLGKVEFYEGCFDVLFLHGHKERTNFGGQCITRRRDYVKCFTINKAIKVVGNIHEKSELLEKKQTLCSNIECRYHTPKDPDGFNCQLFYPPNSECEHYRK